MNKYRLCLGGDLCFCSINLLAAAAATVTLALTSLRNMFIIQKGENYRNKKCKQNPIHIVAFRGRCMFVCLYHVSYSGHDKSLIFI